MKKLVIILGLCIAHYYSSAQLMVNNINITEKAEMFEIWAFKKPFTNKECYFLDYGQSGFKPVNYDLKETQTIRNKDGEKFEKGSWMTLYSYLRNEGYEKESERPDKIGNVEGRVITFIKKKQ